MKLKLNKNKFRLSSKITKTNKYKLDRIKKNNKVKNLSIR